MSVAKVVDNRHSVAEALNVLRGVDLNALDAGQKAELERLSRTVLLASGARLEKIEGQTAVVDTIISGGQKMVVVIWEGSRGKWLPTQRYDAARLGGRIASPRENRVFFEQLRRQEQDGTLNTAGEQALGVYRNGFLRDTEGGLTCNGNCLPPCHDYFGLAGRKNLVLMVFDKGTAPFDSHRSAHC